MRGFMENNTMVNNYDDSIRELVVLSKLVERTGDPEKRKLIKEYLQKLNDLMLNGWCYALGKDNEIDENLLPEKYLSLRYKVIEDLEMHLASCAKRYRASTSGAIEDKQAITDYRKTFEELIRITGKIIGLDPDAELPDNLMPKIYVDYWLE
ncbi:hypothetical protein [Aquimarina mytili]|uniref:Uncharacterized protein n=1 Tax=Aquimarina mytili TaxID=874423 RepID=A0A936ZTA5_9FLAO|nr:hypothetical protein [Aquimarina mytili]MBL0683902.1 hypothetical protein [Aquimarina mytili]